MGERVTVPTQTEAQRGELPPTTRTALGYGGDSDCPLGLGQEDCWKSETNKRTLGSLALMVIQRDVPDTEQSREVFWLTLLQHQRPISPLRQPNPKDIVDCTKCVGSFLKIAREFLGAEQNQIQDK